MHRPLLPTGLVLLLLPLLLMGPVSASQAKTIEECFTDNVWFEQDDKDGKDALALGDRYEFVGRCLCPSGAERGAEDMKVYCRKSGQDYACYKGSPLTGSPTGPFGTAARKACQ